MIQYGGFLKWGYPQVIWFDAIFHYIYEILNHPFQIMTIYGNPHIWTFFLICQSRWKPRCTWARANPSDG